MPSQYIFKSQLNQFIQTLLDSNFDVASFEFNQDLSNTDFRIALPLRLAHTESGFYFRIDHEVIRGNNYFRYTLFPGDEPVEETAITNNWGEVIMRLTTWLIGMESELSQPDPWLLLNEGKMLADNIPSSGVMAERFNEDELIRVREHLQSVRQFLIAEVNPTGEQTTLIDDRLSYLEESAKRQSKQDWGHTAIGVMFTIAIGLAMAPDQANKLFQLTSDFLKSVFFKLLTSGL